MILFLDFDGVLHRFFPLDQGEENAHFYFVPPFEAAVRQAQGPVDIVIASTWRRKFSLDALKAHFSPDIAARIVGATPTVGSGNGPGARQVEVEAWLEAHGRQGEAWVGIDDFPELYAEDAAVVACHDQFADREAELLLEAIADPAAFAQAHPNRHQSGFVLPPALRA